MFNKDSAISEITDELVTHIRTHWVWDSVGIIWPNKSSISGSANATKDVNAFDYLLRLDFLFPQTNYADVGGFSIKVTGSVAATLLTRSTKGLKKTYVHVDNFNKIFSKRYLNQNYSIGHDMLQIYFNNTQMVNLGEVENSYFALGLTVPFYTYVN